jgi:two-component system, sensor histidine kinase YesM
MRRITQLLCCLFFLFLLPMEVKAQDTIIQQKKSKINQAASQLKNSLDVNDEVQIAKGYEALAKGFMDKGDVAKGEEYLKKALQNYTKLNRKKDAARVARSLAKNLEAQNKIQEASTNYRAASEISSDKDMEQINSNDYNRLTNSNTVIQDDYLKSNIELLDKKEKKEEVADLYVQKAENSVKRNDKVDAIESYQQAIKYVKDKPEKVIQLQSEIAKVYALDNQFDKALSINQKLLDEAVQSSDYQTQIAQLQSLSSIFFQKNEPEKAIVSLKKAYQLAAEKGNTAEVKKSLTALLKYYKTNGNDKESIRLYDDFFNNFDRIVASDTSLIDLKTFQITESKIEQLEKEKQLKDELISKKNTFNYFLMGAIVLLLLFFGLIAKALFAIKKKNKEIALQSLRREMNPHFIFNSLNSVNQFISQNKELEANKYLTSYSNLMRNMMENSNKDFVSLTNEINQLKKYLDLEHLRFQDQFDYEIVVDESLDTDAIFIPNMIIQPHLENAIWHGLRYLEHKGRLVLQFKSENNKLVLLIDDDGIGLTRSKELKTVNQKVHESRGLTNTKERIHLLNELYKHHITFEINEKKAPNSGTIVRIEMPVINKVE